jgi:hypothetical protein
MQRILRTWWPLAASWLLMAAELPALTAVVARLPYPEISLAAYGGVVFPLALIIEAPIIMLLAASTALSKDFPSYLLVRRYMMAAGASLTLLHILVAFTPLYYVVVEDMMGVPQVIVEPARLGLMIMTPWTWSIAYRRFNQGVLIRFGHSNTVGIGTLVRLSADGIVLITGYLIGTIPGIAVATAAVATGVISEAIYSGFAVQHVIKGELRLAPLVEPALTWKAFWAFYLPLALTSLLTLLANPIGSAALSRMPQALSSLAVWPVVTGLIFLLRSMGIAFNEVVVALLDQPRSYPNLSRFTLILATATTLALGGVTVTPLANVWFSGISALPAHLAELGRLGLWLALPLPALSVLQSWYQGAILHARRTRAITESVVIYLLTSAFILGAGVAWAQIPGLYIGLAALAASVATQTAWLWWRSRLTLHALRQRDAEAHEPAPSGEVASP